MMNRCGVNEQSGSDENHDHDRDDHEDADGAQEREGNELVNDAAEELLFFRIQMVPGTEKAGEDDREDRQREAEDEDPVFDARSHYEDGSGVSG